MLLRFRLLLFLSLILLLSLFARPFSPSPTLAQDESIQSETGEQVFRSVTASFALFSSLIGDVRYANNSVCPIVLRASSQKEAIDLLSGGFQEDLAQALVGYYMAWDEELGKLVVIPGDSIPIITAADEAEIDITFRNARQVRLERLFYNCYAEGDCYRYIIEAEKEGTQWKISSLSLDEIKKGESLNSRSDFTGFI